VGAESQWEALADLLRRLARGDVRAVEDLEELAADPGTSPEVARAAEDLSLLLVKMEGREYLLTAAEETKDRLRELNELKNRHLGIAAHDLRNPLGTIRGLAKFLTRTDLTEEKKTRFAESVVGIADEMLTLLENLLDVAVIESGELQLDRVLANLGELTRARAERTASSAAKKGIEVAIRVEDVPDTSFDPARIGQVLDNLLSNAAKFTPPGGTVVVSCVRREDRIVIAVADDGPGIPAEELPAIFDAYGRSTTRPTGGEKSTGIGLSTVKPILDAHGGEITVASTVGEGTTFTVSMPVDLPPE
jgi:signal transduction histidine kinase